MELRLLQSLTTRRRPQIQSRLCGASHEVWSPTTLPVCGIYAHVPGLPHPVRSAFRVSHPPDGFLPRRPLGLVSCRSRSWGSPLQSLSLAAKPWCLSTPATLLPSGFDLVASLPLARITRSVAQPSVHCPAMHPRSNSSSAPASGCSTSCESVSCRCEVISRRDRCSPGVLPLQGFTRTEPGRRASTVPPPMGFLASASCANRYGRSVRQGAVPSECLSARTRPRRLSPPPRPS